MRLGDRIAVMRDGRIVQIGTAEDILVDPANDYVASFVQDVDRSRVLTAGSIMEEPRVMVHPNDGPRCAMRALRTDQASAAFVVDPAAGSSAPSPRSRSPRRCATSTATVRDLMDTDWSPPAPTPAGRTAHARLADEAAARRRRRHGRLTGVIPRVTLLAALGDQPETAVASGPAPRRPTTRTADATARSRRPPVPRIHLGNWAEDVVDWLTDHFSWLFDFISSVVNGMYDGVEWVLGGPTPLLMAGILAVIALLDARSARRRAGLRRLRADRLDRPVGPGDAVAVAGGRLRA